MINKQQKGLVYLIGAGPGDIRLITKWGMDILKKADIVFFDRLVNPSFLSFTKRDAELIYVGKAPNDHFYLQEEINQKLVDSVNKGKIVVRLKGGDPYIFGRGGEEALELSEAGVEFKVVPGITSVLAAASYAGIPLTHRGLSSSFHVFSAHDIKNLNFEYISYLSGTLIFVMGLGNLSKITSGLIEHGFSTSKPVAVIHYGTTSAQEVIIGDLKNIYYQVKNKQLESPILIVIGEVVNLAKKLNWFKRGLLAGKRIMITRTKRQQFELGDKITELGGEPFYFPTIMISGPLLDRDTKNKFLRIKEYDWILLTSTNAVGYFFEILRLLKIDIRVLSDKSFAAIGSATAEALEEKGIFSDLLPENSTSENLAETFIGNSGEKVDIFIPGSKKANRGINSLLKKEGHRVTRANIYEPIIPVNEKIEFKQIFKERPVDIITFTSPSTVKNFVHIIGGNLQEVYKIPTVCIGPVTAECARGYGFNVVGIADNYNIDGLIKAVIRCCQKKT